jgi:hypothetical protein
MARAEMFQDNKRETQIANFLGLTPSELRAGEDAIDSHGHPFELKSASKTQVTTGRDVGVHTIAKWRQTYWVVACGKQDKRGVLHLSALFVAHPTGLESWFSKWETVLKDEERRFTRVLRSAKRAGASDEDIEFVRKKCERGITRNNPKIPLKIFRDNGLQLDHQNAAKAREQLSRFVRRHRLQRS